MNALNIEQGSPEWLKARLGVITASNVSKALAKKGSETRNGYMMELIGQVVTGEAEELFAKSLEWGKTHEPVARARYVFETDAAIEEIGFVYGPDKRTGCSPDFWVPALAKGGEIKCPITPRVHLDFLAADKIKPEYVLQVQFGMWVTGAELWDFCSFHAKFKAPGTTFKIVTVERDDETMKRFDDEINGFIHDMDQVMNKLGIQWSSQWSS